MSFFCIVQVHLRPGCLFFTASANGFESFWERVSLLRVSFPAVSLVRVVFSLVKFMFVMLSFVRFIVIESFVAFSAAKA